VLEPLDNPFGPGFLAYVAVQFCNLCVRAGPPLKCRAPARLDLATPCLENNALRAAAICACLSESGAGF